MTADRMPESLPIVIPVCHNCDGNGWVYDYLGGCGDPECCGGPYKVKCRECANDLDPGADGIQ